MALTVNLEQISSWFDLNLGLLDVELKDSKVLADFIAGLGGIKSSKIISKVWNKSRLLTHHLALNFPELGVWNLDAAVSRINDSNFGIVDNHIIVVVNMLFVIDNVVDQESPVVVANIGVICKALLTAIYLGVVCVSKSNRALLCLIQWVFIVD